MAGMNEKPKTLLGYVYSPPKQVGILGHTRREVAALIAMLIFLFLGIQPWRENRWPSVADAASLGLLTGFILAICALRSWLHSSRSRGTEGDGNQVGRCRSPTTLTF
jgi:hypothetical protein